MDVNGTRFHLILGESDWSACVEERDEGALPALEWDDLSHALTLTPILSLFRPARPRPDLLPADRRGAAADRHGNWYWISRDEKSILWSPPGGRPRTFWDGEACEDPPPDRDDAFAPRAPAPVGPRRLAGLAVTEHHYLVVGDVTGHGLLLFDLHAGGPPLELRVPLAIPYAPFDLCAAPGGGVWILDRDHRAYWGLDRFFRTVTKAGQLAPIEPGETESFHPLGGGETVHPGRSFPRGFALGTQDPISIEALPDGSVLVLDRGDGADASTISRHRLTDQIGAPVALAAAVPVDTGSGRRTDHLSVAAHDIAYVHDGGSADAGHGRLYAADRDGAQTIAFDLAYDRDVVWLTPRIEFLPMHAFGGRALGVVPPSTDVEQGAWYDVMAGGRRTDDAVRWSELAAIDQPRHAREAQLLLAAPARTGDALAVLDSRTPDCTWHRLFLDACIPPGTSVRVSSRAANDVRRLDALPFRLEPAPYLRPAGAELPFYEPFGDDGNGSDPEGLGTWETLFQAARGRYIQVRLVLEGDGRATPSLRAARIYYPRVSYVGRYLPAVYQDDAASAGFTERWLANVEGFNTEIEGRIAFASRLFDPRTAPPETLDWLAGWVGLLVDPVWARIQARRARAAAGIATGGRTHGIPSVRPAPDRRRLFIRFARKLYERRGTLEGIRFALILLLDPCLEETLEAFRQGGLRTNLALRDELRRHGLPYPTPATREDELEDLLYAYVLAPRRPSKVRIVEHFQARDGRALAVGDVTPEAQVRESTIAATAHRFSVLVPERLMPEEAAMVGRIVGLEKPAHTAFEVHRYYDLFRVGEARLGTDTVVGDGGRFVATVLDDGQMLAQGYLAAAPPMDTLERLIADRDRPGDRAL
jgi:phage tail-like protein